MASKSTLIACLLAFAISGRAEDAAPIRGPLVQHNLSLSMAMAMAQEAIATCKHDGFSVTVVVVDRAGEPILVLRSDTANPHNAELARRKAYTALTFRKSSGEWSQMLQSTPAIAAQRDLKDVIA
jgi:uncharacterized protein GlcG (DUF336 family)